MPPRNYTVTGPGVERTTHREITFRFARNGEVTATVQEVEMIGKNAGGEIRLGNGRSLDRRLDGAPDVPIRNVNTDALTGNTVPTQQLIRELYSLARQLQTDADA